jgi:hypothetical protein
MNADLQVTLLNSMSTIAETLAGAMGLLGAIVLFALQATARSIERAAESLTEVPQQAMTPLYLSHLLTRRSYHELARAYGSLLSNLSSETNSSMLLHYSALCWELDHDHALRRSFWMSLRATGAVVTFAIVCGAVAPQLAARPDVGDIALAGAVLGAIGCLLLYGILLNVMLRSSPQEPIPTATAGGEE